MQPGNAESYVLLGEALFALGETRIAIDALRRAIALEPENADYRVALGDAYSALGAKKAAQLKYDEAVAIDRKKEEARARQRDAARGQRFKLKAPMVDAEPVTERKWYGLALGLTYFLAPVVLIGSAAISDCEICMVPAFLLTLLAPPGVHWSYGNAVGGIMSLLITPLISLTAGAIVAFATSSSCEGDMCGMGGFPVGMAIGYALWAISDTAFLAYREVPVQSEQPTARRPGPRLMVGASPVQGGAVGTVVGRF
jgi:hypothetical protein